MEVMARAAGMVAREAMADLVELEALPVAMPLLGRTGFREMRAMVELAESEVQVARDTVRQRRGRMAVMAELEEMVGQAVLPELGPIRPMAVMVELAATPVWLAMVRTVLTAWMGL